MEALRERFWWAENAATTVAHDGDDVRWWTFAGLHANAQLAEQLGDLTRGARSRDNLSIQLVSGTRRVQVVERLAPLKTIGLAEFAWPDTQETPLPKFAECLPPSLAASTVAARASDPSSVSACLQEEVRSATLVD